MEIRIATLSRSSPAKTMSVSSRLWIRCFDTALASATSPFLISLSHGHLAKNSFKAYIAQDAFYLVSFKQAFANAATICRKDSDGFGVVHFESLETLIEGELEMHAKFALDLDIDLTSVRPFPQTLLYTEFLSEASKTNYVSHICAAMTPCMTLYGFLGRRAKAAGLLEVSNPYARWIEEYSSPEFTANSERLEMLLDHFAAKDNQKFEDLIKLYAKAMELEYNFFSAHETPNWTGISPSFLGVDFDDTISVGDTISNLCKAGLKAQGKSNEADYDDLFVKYLAQYEAFMSSNLPQVGSSTTYRGNDLELFMKTYSAFEDGMLIPVEDSGILKGISASTLNILAASMLMKPNAIETMKFATHNHPGMELHILSVNWSKRFLESMIKVQWPESKISVHANELDGLQESISADSISTGMIEKRLTGPLQKGELLRKLFDADRSKSDGPRVYIGDSIGDLSALLEADIGIVIGTSSSLRKVCSIYGIKLQSLDCLMSQKSAEMLVKDSIGQPSLYIAESWAHIGFCVFGNTYVTSWLRSFIRDINHGIASPLKDKGIEKKMFTVLSVAGSDSGVKFHY